MESLGHSCFHLRYWNPWLCSFGNILNFCASFSLHSSHLENPQLQIHMAEHVSWNHMEWCYYIFVLSNLTYVFTLANDSSICPAPVSLPFLNTAHFIFSPVSLHLTLLPVKYSSCLPPFHMPLSRLHWTCCSQKTSWSVLPLGLCTFCFLFLECLSLVSVETYLSLHLDAASQRMLYLTPYSQASFSVLIIVCITLHHDLLKTHHFNPNMQWSKTVLNPGLLNEWA